MRFPFKEIARILIGFWFGECDAFYPKFLAWLYRVFPEKNVCIQMSPFITLHSFRKYMMNLFLHRFGDILFKSKYEIVGVAWGWQNKL